MTTQEQQKFSLEEKSQTVAEFLKTLGNTNRLQILCLLLSNGEMCVTHLHENLENLSQSALSQHLAKMREEGILSFRRDAQTLYYKISDERVAQVMQTLREIFCHVKLETLKNDSTNHQSTTSGGTHQ